MSTKRKSEVHNNLKLLKKRIFVKTRTCKKYQLHTVYSVGIAVKYHKCGNISCWKILRSGKATKISQMKSFYNEE